MNEAKQWGALGDQAKAEKKMQEAHQTMNLATGLMGAADGAYLFLDWNFWENEKNGIVKVQFCKKKKKQLRKSQRHHGYFGRVRVAGRCGHVSRGIYDEPRYPAAALAIGVIGF